MKRLGYVDDVKRLGYVDDVKRLGYVDDVKRLGYVDDVKRLGYPVLVLTRVCEVLPGLVSKRKERRSNQQLVSGRVNSGKHENNNVLTLYSGPIHTM